MTAPESQVLAAIAELEAEENPDDITELVRWQVREGLSREYRQERQDWAPPHRTNPLGELIRPEPSGPFVYPSGRWWRCDTVDGLTVNIQRQWDGDIVEWKITVGEEVVAEYRYPEDDEVPVPVEFEPDTSAPSWNRRVLWLAIHCEGPPPTGEWYHWERAALVPVSG